MSVSDKVLDAIQILTKSYIRKAGYDRTIQAQIVSCEDATIGKYRCRYQDAIIYAYANSADVTYTKGSSVYILVPGNDMTKEKTILGSTEKLGINYISQAEGDQAYNIIGNNCITSNQKLYLDTNNKNYKYTIYSSQAAATGNASTGTSTTGPGDNNIITIDTDALNHYIKQSSSLIVGATFKTSIPQDKQTRGHYGITYNLKFLDNTSNREVIRSYTVDEDNMVNNPYRLLYDTRQYEIFDIDGANFISLESIEIFNKDFPKAENNITEEMLTAGDIEISALELYGAVRMTQEEINGVAISFYTPQGTFFVDGSTSASYKTITAQVKIKGKLASAAQNIPFYWGIENAGISTQSEYYNKYLGRGWKCLNDKNIIKPQTKTQAAIIEWVPSTDTYIVKFNQATAKNNKFKVAVVYNENVITKQINIENLTSALDLTIESSDGTKFYYDVGHPTLTCKVNGEQLTNYTYSWAYESNTGLFENLLQTTDLNTEYNAAVAALQELQTAIAAGTKFANAEADNLNALQTAIEQYKFIQRVQGNKIYDVQINHITNFGTFKCSVYNEQGTYCGTCSITLTNSLQSEDLYSLVINNGAVTFQYNENGVAPNNRSLDIQQQIQALSFTVYDNLGNPIDNDVIVNDSNCQIRWAIPIKNTMLIDRQDSESSSGTDETETYRYYDNVVNLVYDIAQRYNVSNSRNQIQLTVDYKGMSLTAETDFTFVKQGEPGTNGTEYIVKLVPNTRMSNPPLWPMITTWGVQLDQYSPVQSICILNYGLNSFQEQQQISIYDSYQFFKAQLWHNGELVWQGNTASDIALDNITNPESINWGILKNKYNSSSQDLSDFIVADGNNGLFRYNANPEAQHYSVPYANIIKCGITWQGKTYYGTIPIITAWVDNANIRVSLKDYTGWRYAIYTSDGVLPQYDNANPFEFLIKEKINDIWEDVSLIQEGDHVVEYEFNSIGNYKNTGTGSTTNADLIEILNSPVYTKDCQKNQIKARPASRYDGVCVNAAIVCTYKRNDSIIGKICVPIHFLLNRYGLAQINDWDGNSVQIDNDGGFILSPQMGAGSKNSSNQFTGVLMGEVRTAGKSRSNTGLFGYDKGVRSFFLNSQNGSALFGKQKNGQIIIDPTVNRALIYSGNFWKDSYYDSETGLPNYIYTGSEQFYKNYRSNAYAPKTSNINSNGLLIDLTKPEIYYGSGKFYVTEQGQLHATEANISGNITATSLTLGSDANIAASKVSGLAKIATSGSYNDLSDAPIVPDMSNVLYKGDVTVTQTTDSTTGITTTTYKVPNAEGGVTTWKEYTSGNEPGYVLLGVKRGNDSTGQNYFKVSTDGLLKARNAVIYGTIYATDGEFAGKITANSGSIGGWSISSTSLSKSTGVPAVGEFQYIASMNAPASVADTSAAFAIQSRERTGGTDAAPTYGSWTWPFYVRYKDGYLHATNADIKGTITATSLNIQGTQIGGTNLLLDTLKDKDESHTSYSLCDFNFTEHLVTGQSYTITAKITLSSERNYVAFFHSGGSIDMSPFIDKTSDGIYRYTFTATSNMASQTGGIGYGFCRVYARSTASSTSVTGSGHVDWIKIEQGKNATAWSPAPDDAENKANSHTDSIKQTLQTSITENAIAITKKVSSADYAIDKAGLDKKIGGVQSTLQQLPDSISGTIKKTYIDPITDQLAEEQKWIRFSSSDYLEIGLSTSNYKTQITNSAFNIKNGNTNIASFSSDGLHTSSITMDDGSELVLPPLMIEPYSNGWLIKRAAT